MAGKDWTYTPDWKPTHTRTPEQQAAHMNELYRRGLIGTNPVKAAKREAIARMATAQYLELIDRIGYAPARAAALRARIEAGDREARYVVYQTALDEGHLGRA